MKNFLLTLLAIGSFICATAQNPQALLDSAKRELARAKTAKEKVDKLYEISAMLMNTDMNEAELYSKKMIEAADESRDRRLMIQALRRNSDRYAAVSFNKEYIAKATDYANRALALARSYHMEDEVAECLLRLAYINKENSQLDPALEFANQAFSISSSLKNKDTLLCSNYLTLADIYQAKKETVPALRNYLNGLRVAEESKMPALLRACYSNLSGFYSSIKQYDKAVDYTLRAMDILPLADTANKGKYQRPRDLYDIGNIYTAKKDNEMAIMYYERSIRSADTAQYPPLKVPGYYGLLNQYTKGDQPQKALDYLQKDTAMKQFFRNFNMAHSIDNAYASVYSRLGKYDSAEIYFKRAEPAFQNNTPPYRISFYRTVADHYKRWGKTASQLSYLLKADTLARQIGDIDWLRITSKELDTAYAKAGNLSMAYTYSSLYNKYNDSVNKLEADKGLMQAEITDEEQRQQRLTAEAQAIKDRRHQVQYLGITIFIAGLFVLLTISGFVRVSDKAVRIVGYFSFLMFFEFIFLISKKSVTAFTQGEPWKDLTFMILLAALLLPLHHWVEEKVMHYLAAQRRKRLQASVDKSGALVSHGH